MNKKLNLVMLISLFFVLLVNYIFIKNPITHFLDKNDLISGIFLIAAVIVFYITGRIIVKLINKPNIAYHPKVLWVISYSLFAGGVFMIAKFFIERLFDSKLSEVYLSLFIHLIISTVTVSLLYELIHYGSGFPLRNAIKNVEIADKLVKERQFKKALAIYDNSLGRIDVNREPQIYAWIKQSKGICYLELSRIEDKMTNLVKGIRDLEDILTIKEIQNHQGPLKLKLGDVYHELSELEFRAEYLVKSLNFYQGAMHIFSKNQEVDNYMNALNNAEKIKSKLLLLKTN